MTENTRDKILSCSIALMAQKGFNYTGIAEILAKAEVPKGSFYHYFKSKDALGLAIIDQYGESLAASLADFLDKQTTRPLVRLRAYFESVIALYSTNFKFCNCLLGNFGQELSLQDPDFRAAIFTQYARIESIIAAVLREAQAEGSLSAAADADMFATALLSGWEGALIRAKLAQSIVPVQQFLIIFFEYSLPILKH